ncbi:MAG: tetratricopeptide repeat protein [Acidobacteriota bacterium]
MRVPGAIALAAVAWLWTLTSAVGVDPAVARTAGEAEPTPLGRAEALERLRGAADRGPLPRDLAMQLASIEMAEGNTADAARQLESVAERFDSVRALLGLAQLRSRSGDVEGAFEALDRARDLAPNAEKVLAAHARTALAMGRPMAAIQGLEQLCRMHSTVPQYPYLLGIARLQVGDLAGSEEILGTAMELDPRSVLTRVALGLVYNKQKRYEEARGVLEEAARLDPAELEVAAALAESFDGLGDLTEAEALARRVLEARPDHGNANLVVGLVRMKQERYAEAKDAFERALRAESSPKVHYQLSLAWARLGDRERSQHHLERYRASLRDMEAHLRQLGVGAPAAEQGGAG